MVFWDLTKESRVQLHSGEVFGNFADKKDLSDLFRPRNEHISRDIVNKSNTSIIATVDAIGKLTDWPRNLLEQDGTKTGMCLIAAIIDRCSTNT